MALTDSTVVSELQQELDQVRDAKPSGIVRTPIPHTPAVDVTALLASGLAHLARARRLHLAAGAALQRAQVGMVEDPTPVTEGAVRRARRWLDYAEGDEDLAAREIASYRIRVAQANGHD